MLRELIATLILGIAMKAAPADSSLRRHMAYAIQSECRSICSRARWDEITDRMENMFGESESRP